MPLADAPAAEVGGANGSADDFVPSLDVLGQRGLLRGAYGLMALLQVALLALLGLSRVDVIVQARGVVAPRGETARVQASRAGTVEAILVREGQAVAAGDVLVRLDQRSARAALEQVRDQLGVLERRIQIADALRASRSRELERAGELAALAVSSSRVELTAARLRGDARQRQLEAALAERTRATLLVQAGTEAVASADKAALQNDLATFDLQLAKVDADELALAVRRRSAELDRDQHAAAVSRLTDDAQLADLHTERVELMGKQSELVLVAPRAGVVEHMTVRDVGDFVPNGSTVAFVVPETHELELLVDVPAAEAADVFEGQGVNIKIDAFPFQDYGRARGRVLTFARDASRSESGERSASFLAHVGVTDLPAAGGQNAVQLRPGMTVTAELVVRRERLALSLLGPLRGLFDSVRR